MNKLRSYGSRSLYEFIDEIGRIVSRVKYSDSGDSDIRWYYSTFHIVVSIDPPKEFPYLFVPELKKQLRQLGAQYDCPEGFCVTQDDNDERVLLIGTTILLDPLKVALDIASDVVGSSVR